MAALLDDGSEDAASDALTSEFGEKPSALSQEPDFEAKWKVQRGYWTSLALTLGCLWLA